MISKTLLAKYLRDKNGQVVMWQTPNLPLWGWGVFTILSKVTNGRPNIDFGLLSRASLFVWAILEILTGQSPFRRSLGLVVMAYIIIGL
jgi:hypothetical protein